MLVTILLFLLCIFKPTRFDSVQKIIFTRDTFIYDSILYNMGRKTYDPKLQEFLLPSLCISKAMLCRVAH